LELCSLERREKQALWQDGRCRFEREDGTHQMMTGPLHRKAASNISESAHPVMNTTLIGTNPSEAAGFLPVLPLPIPTVKWCTQQNFKPYLFLASNEGRLVFADGKARWEKGM